MKRALGAALSCLLVLSSCAPNQPADEPRKAISYAVEEPITLHPGRQTIAFAQDMVLFSGLTFAGKDGAITFRNAESVTSTDAVRWTIKLRPRWTFHNGEPVTAKSYVKAWSAVAYGPNAWENSGQLANIAGYDALNPANGKPAATELSGLKIVDDLTFTVTLKSPDGQFPAQLSQAQTGFYPLPEAAYADPAAFAKNPIGNGPFRMTQPYRETEPMTVDRYDGYQGPQPSVDEITFKPYTDMNTAYTDVQAGATDILYVPNSRMGQVKKDFGDRAHVFQGLAISYLGLPLWDKRYQDIRVRQAISLAIDREAVSKAIFDGIWEPATALTPPAQPGTPRGLCGDLCTFDPVRARKLLAEAGGFSGTMEIRFPGGFGRDDLFNAYANQLRQNLGIKDVTAKPTADFPEFFELRTGAKLSGPYFARWGALYASQQNTLRAIYTRTGGCSNCVPDHDPAIAQLIAKADAQVDPQRAIAGYVDVQKAILKRFPAPPMFFEKNVFATSERIASLDEGAGLTLENTTLVR
ncbi:ABC transporter substrate-binding protein [Kribbella sandramycini]|uniref:ABC transporter substrate-binding protein n=1 Tax=Kribbella sandramycini TaxID=60450 RepID=A0A7Y4L3X2_9ACTN|nr:ABC transporter substrate-binding protein [Kribbella sandramycini]MBB6570778.1 peptide/nickel transport system substrate-binding protein/oligopeptide transport system substrate-binding protein [Kribbella sandramycini]NOL43918.1 ABC transporter substrate-binding protein [Kribbella sandramycini]